MKTAIDWYIDELFKITTYYLNNEINSVELSNRKHKLYQEAKEKEKQQIIDANNQGYKAGRGHFNQTATEYYTETYGHK